MRYVALCHEYYSISYTRTEPECCDGSDEPSGVCKNICKKVGEEYRERMKAENKLRKTVRSDCFFPTMETEVSSVRSPQGSKIRSTYIAFAQKEKKRLEVEISQTELEIGVREKEVARLRGPYVATTAYSLRVLMWPETMQTSWHGPSPSLLQPWKRRRSPVGRAHHDAQLHSVTRSQLCTKH